MSDKKNVSMSVESIVEELKKNPSSRFSKSDFQTLVYGVLSDSEFKAKRYLLKNDEIMEEDAIINDGMKKFLDKLLKHAGMTDSAERANIIDTFEFTPKDVEWLTEAVDEAMYIYSECGKNMRMFRSKMLQLAVKKMVRTGKYAGAITYKKMVTDRAAMLAKKNK